MVSLFGFFAIFHLLFAEEYFQNKYVLISLYFLLLYSDSLMAVYYGTMLQEVQHSKSQNANKMFMYFQTCYSKSLKYHNSDIP